MKKRKKILRGTLISLIFYVLIILILYPKEMIQASSRGLLLWVNIVFPSLFPFMVGVSLLSMLGVSNILGKVLKPFMRPFFHVPGCASFPYILGFLSGYPLGASMTANLLEEGEITPTEAQRILSFANNPGLLFLLGTVSTGMLQNTQAGSLLFFSIFLSSLTTGFLFRFYEPKEGNRNGKERNRKKQGISCGDFGQMLQKSVENAMNTILQIGGFIILFSVIISSFHITGIMEAAAEFLYALSFLPLSKESIRALLGGFIEMTNGVSQAASSASELKEKLVLISVLLSFGGLSILSQTISVLKGSPVQIGVYIFSKALNGVFSGIYVFLLYPLFQNKLTETVPAFHPIYSTGIRLFLLGFSILCILYVLCCLFFTGKKKKNMKGNKGWF